LSRRCGPRACPRSSGCRAWSVRVRFASTWISESDKRSVTAYVRARGPRRRVPARSSLALHVRDDGQPSLGRAEQIASGRRRGVGPLPSSARPCRDGSRPASIRTARSPPRVVHLQARARRAPPLQRWVPTGCGRDPTARMGGPVKLGISDASARGR
jgi:hypothetical protein